MSDETTKGRCADCGRTLSHGDWRRFVDSTIHLATPPNSSWTLELWCNCGGTFAPATTHGTAAKGEK